MTMVLSKILPTFKLIPYISIGVNSATPLDTNQPSHLGSFKRSLRLEVLLYNNLGHGFDPSNDRPSSSLNFGYSPHAICTF